MINKLIFALCLSVPLCNAATEPPSPDALLRQGTNLQLQGNYLEATAIGEQLKQQFPASGLGQALNINALVTRLSWDLEDTQFDAALKSETSAALDLCEQKIAKQPDNSDGYYLCGQARFALTFLYAARGSYFRGGRNATQTIEQLEQTLARDPDLTDAKMHLGITYYYADNLPPFVRAISRFLKFVPSGNSAKSLPYLKEAAQSGLYLGDAAKYLYADLIMSSEPERLEEAGVLLNDLVTRFPSNRRFQFKYIAYWAQRGDFDQALKVANDFAKRPSCCPLPVEDLNLVNLWRANAQLASGKPKEARAHLTTVDPSVLPSWAKHWYEDSHQMLADQN